MKYYMAPLEGITGYIYRNAYSTYFRKFDKYFTPFLSPHGEKENLTHRERNDVAPEHNEGLYVVPQILTNKSSEFIRVAKYLQGLGYEEVNLNLGCPSGTVVSKYKGAGFLAKPEELRGFLTEIFEALDMRISVKTRIGVSDVTEFSELMQIFEQFPLEELIIHPRLRQEFYNGTPHMEVFHNAAEHTKLKLCYNGDLVYKAQIEELCRMWQSPEEMREEELFPGKMHEEEESTEGLCGTGQQETGKLTGANTATVSIMLGRGVLRNPGILQLAEEGIMPDKRVIKEFHDRLYNDYREIMPGERPTLFKMKELWSYMGTLFTGWEECRAKQIRKANRLSDYELIAKQLFRDEGYVEKM